MPNFGPPVIPEKVDPYASGTLAQAIEGARVTIDDEGHEIIINELGVFLAFADDRELWDRQPGESDRHWEAFRLYRDAPSHERRFVVVARKMRGLEPDEYTTAGWIGQWAKRNRWEERIFAFDNYINQKETEALIQARIQARVDASHVANALKEKALEAVSVLKAIVTEHKKRPDGTIETVTRSALTATEIARLAELGIKLERQALDMDNANPDGTTKEGGPSTSVTVNLFGQATEADILARAQAIIEAREMQQRTVEGIAQIKAAAAREVAESTPSVPHLAAGPGGVQK